MRLAKLDLLAYGPFRGVTIDFSRPGIHIVFGRNEAGKSTTLRAITGLLYGIDRMTQDAHVHKMTDLRIGGTLESQSGGRLRIVRRKGQTNTLLDDSGQPIDESALKKLLGGVTVETFRSAFGLDHESLAAGAKALLEGKGDLGESLFDASVGGGGEVQRLLADLANEADQIFKPRGTTLPLNEALKGFSDAQRSIRERQSLPEAFLTQEKALDEAMRDRAELATKKATQVQRLACLTRIRRRVPLERRRDRAKERQAELGPIAFEVDRVLALKDRYSAYERALDQRRIHISEVERLSDRLAEATRRAGVDDPTELDARREARIHVLLKDRTALTQRLDSAHKEVDRLEREIERLQTAPAEPAADTTTLSVALERARALGDIEARIKLTATTIERERKKLESRARVLLEVPIDKLVSLKLPAPASIERLIKRASEVERTLGRLDDHLERLEDESAALTKEIGALAGDFAPPDAAALASTRKARDDAWTVYRERKKNDVEVDRLLREADAMADRMIREAERVTTLARLRSEEAENVRQREKLMQDRARANELDASLRAELASLFEDSKVPVQGFEEMHRWLVQHAQVTEAHANLVRVEEARDDEVAKANAALTALRSALTTKDGDLGELIARATRALKAAETKAREEEERARTVERSRAERANRVADRAHDEATLADVKAKLAELLGPLGVPVDASVEEVNRSIEALREVFTITDKRSDTESRAKLADADVRTFEADLLRAVTELAPALDSSRPIRDLAPALFQNATEARDVAQHLATAERDLAVEAERESPQGAAPSSEQVQAWEASDRLLDHDAASRLEQDLTDELDELDRSLERLDQHVGGIRKGMTSMQVESQAAEAAASAQLHLARIRENTERWARVKLAHVLLSREIERYRQENQGPLLASSSQLFARLTEGAFSGIRAGFDDKDRPCLRCVRVEPQAEVDVTGLSDGTRDQLYLSLRLASLLRRGEMSEPMPLVLDDVLVHFDDQRSAAALQVLAEVSQHMQVLFFTHHARLVELARSKISSDSLVVHELNLLREAMGSPEADAMSQ